MIRVILGVAVGVAVAAAVAHPAVMTAGQDNRPGQPTIARMYVLNQGHTEAIPVVLHRGDIRQPVELPPDTMVVTRPTRVGWEYRQFSVEPGEDPVSALNKAGLDGWELVGAIGGGNARATFVLKRIR
jgi:hypothetical protein